jgi:hypothetical protein
MGFHQNKKFLRYEGVNGVKRQSTEWKKIVQNYTTDKRLIHKEIKNSTAKTLKQTT